MNLFRVGVKLLAATFTQAAVSTGNIKPRERRVEHNLVRDLLVKEILKKQKIKKQPKAFLFEFVNFNSKCKL